MHGFSCGENSFLASLGVSRADLSGVLQLTFGFEFGKLISTREEAGKGEVGREPSSIPRDQGEIDMQ